MVISNAAAALGASGNVLSSAETTMFPSPDSPEMASFTPVDCMLMDVSVVDPRSALTMESVTGTSMLSGVVTEIVVDTNHFPFEEVNVLLDSM